MAPVKPMGVNVPKGTKPGVTGFPQEYNQQEPPRQDLNPDVVDNPDTLPPPQTSPNVAGQPRGRRKGAAKSTAKRAGGRKARAKSE